MAGIAAAFIGPAEAADVSHEMGKIKTSALREVSGIAASKTNPKVLWLHNDGSSGDLVALSSTGKLVALLQCDSPIVDLEDVAIGPGPQPQVDYLYLGDIGDNAARRNEIRVIRFAEPRLSGDRGQTMQIREAQEFRLVYPDGPHDAEALLIDPETGDVVIVTKERRVARLYTVSQKSLNSKAPAQLTLAGNAEASDVSAGSISPNGKLILLRRESQGWLWRRKAGASLTETLAAKPEKVAVQGKRQGPNGEAVSFSPSGDSYYTVSEGKKQSIYLFDVPQ